MSNSFSQQLSKQSSARSYHRLLNRCGLLVLGSGWIVAIAMAGMGVTNFCFSGKQAGNYSSSAMSTNDEGIVQSSKSQFSVPFWIYLLLIVGASPWLFTYLRKRSIASNSKKTIRSSLRCSSTHKAGLPSSVQPIAGHTSNEKEWQGVLPKSSHDLLPPVNSRVSSQPISFISQGEKPVSYRISRVSSRQPSALMSSTLSVGAKNIRLPFEQLK
jgi:hypothetical protein